MPIDPLAIATGIGGSLLTALGLLWKRDYDLRKIRTEEQTARAGAQKAIAETRKIELDIERRVDEAVLKHIEHTQDVNLKWTDKVEAMIGKVETLTGELSETKDRLRHVEGELRHVEGELKVEQSARVILQKEHQQCRKESVRVQRLNEHLIKENGELKVQLYTMYDGFQTAMNMYVGASQGKEDAVYDAVNRERIRAAEELEAVLRTRRDQEKAAAAPTAVSTTVAVVAVKETKETPD